MQHATFEAWNASRQMISAEDVPANHPANDMGRDYDALHVFDRGEWIMQLPDGQFWSIVQFDEIATASLAEASQWLWDRWSSDLALNL